MARKWHIAILLMIALFGYGCSGHATPNLTQQQFADLISHYRQGDEPLSIRKLTQRSAAAFPGERDSIDVSILVHPGYSVFVNNVIEKTYGHKAYYLTAIKNELSADKIVGILPLVHLKHFLFGNNLISMPFCDLDRLAL